MFFLMLDIGQDGTGLEVNARFGRDAAALMLQYYDGDYTPVAGSGNFNLFSADAVGLYNGNIAALSTATYSMMPLLKLFRYDKLNRIKQMQTAGISAGEWGSLTDNFSTEYRYDYNGNILSLQRKDATAQVMHHINYTYNAKNNRLQAITATGINSSNYSYDAIGNLANDSGESIGVTWNAMNKVKTVTTPNNNLSFSYSPTGQRQIKKTGDKTEYYLHDATGNIMCVYELSGNYLTVKERTIYGSKRIGVYRQRIQLTAFTGFGQAELLPGSGLVNVLHPSPIISPDGRQYLEGSNRLQVIGVARTTLSVNTLAYKKGTIELKGLSPSIAARPIFLDGAKTAGLRDYELTDHLSNVMAVISDRKLSVDTNNDTITDYYEPQVVSFTDYYPFGFSMADRSGNLAGYRFGFNGQEADNEVYGTKTTYAFEYRMQDTRLGRFWSVDPLVKQYPYNSSYAFAENSPIAFGDLEGLERYFAAGGVYLGQKVILNSDGTINKQKSNQIRIMNANSQYKQSKPVDFLLNNSVPFHSASESAQKAVAITIYNSLTDQIPIKNMYINAENVGTAASASTKNIGDMFVYPNFITQREYINDNYYNQLNNWVHESYQIKSKLGGSGFEEFKVNIYQIAHWSFKNTTNAYKEYVAGVMRSNLQAQLGTLMNPSFARKKYYNSFVEQYNQNVKVLNFYIDKYHVKSVEKNKEFDPNKYFDF